MAVSRDKLYEEVWAEPMVKVAARYTVSSNFLARVCERLNVPKPPRGYWAQRAVGKVQSRPPLPEAEPGDELEWVRNGVPKRAPFAPPKPPDDLARRRPRPRSERPSRHELLSSAREHFDAASEVKTGHLRPSKFLLADIFVSKDTLGRAFDVANELFLSLEDRGHRVTLAPSNGPCRRPDLEERSDGGQGRYYHGSRWAPSRATVVFVGTVAIGLTLFELSEYVEARYVDGNYVRASRLPAPKRRDATTAHALTFQRDLPCGRLALRATSPYAGPKWERQWRESEPGELVAKIGPIIKELEAAAPTIARLAEEGEREAEAERQRLQELRQQWEREAAERRRAQNVEESREQLFAIIETWNEAKRIEDFFEQVRQRVEGLAEKDREALLERLHRARSLLGASDVLDRFRAWQAPDERR